MAPRNLSAVRGKGFKHVRARLLSALHVGKLRPGDRVPSVRRLADLTGINHKTVHRAYTALAKEGILDVRPGSGTFVGERRSSPGDQSRLPGLSQVIERCRLEAGQLGLSPETYSHFVSICLADGLGGLPVGVIECNWEQITIIGRDLGDAFNLSVRPILLSALEKDPAEALGAVGSVVTTDCHYSQVVEKLEPLGVATYTVTLDQVFPRQLLDLAREDDIVMVLQDRAFGPVLRRLLTQLEGNAESVRRIRFVGEREAPRVLRSASNGTWVHYSPVLPSSKCRGIPRHLRLLELAWSVDSAALESLRAALALDLTLREVDSKHRTDRTSARAI
jgi:DNA-binding transcriptional regulator YhcF (GntR family)